MKSLTRLEQNALRSIARFYALRLKSRTHPRSADLLEAASKAREDAMRNLKSLHLEEKTLGLA